MPNIDPAAQLRRIAYLLERDQAATYRVRAYRRAVATVDATPDLRAYKLTDLPGIGPSTASVIAQALDGAVSDTLAGLEATHWEPGEAGATLRAALRGDLHTHSDWSDGGSSIAEMVAAALGLGHEYVALTDHSPRLTVAHGLTAERLRDQLEVVAALNADLAPFRILTGIEVDIRDDGTLDQDADLLAELDVVVASVHSKLRMDRDAMTRRMVAAIANPNVDVLGHCTGRLLPGRGRPESDFDSEIVFAACEKFGVAVEFNSRPERLDPPKRLVAKAIEAGCRFSVDTDAHAPGQLEWQPYGCARAEECGVPAEGIVNTWPLDDLLAWTGRASG